MSSTTPKYQIPNSFNFFSMDGKNNESYSLITARSFEGKPISSYGWRLPIPNLLNYESDYDWSEEETDWVLTAMKTRDVGYLAGKGMDFVMDSLKNNVNEILNDKSVKNRWFSKLLKAGGDEKSKNFDGKILGMSGLAYNPNKQLYFSGVKHREFDVYFYLTPLSQKEADNIKAGYKKLAYNAAPSFAAMDYFFKYPLYFDFEVKVNNVSVLKRQNLVITKVHLDFTSDGNVTWHEDGFPTSMQMTVGFKELNIPTQENLKDVTIFGSPFGDSNKINE